MSYITGATNYDTLEDAVEAFAEYTEGQAELVVREDSTATIYRLQDKPAHRDNITKLGRSVPKNAF